MNTTKNAPITPQRLVRQWIALAEGMLSSTEMALLVKQSKQYVRHDAQIGQV